MILKHYQKFKGRLISQFSRTGFYAVRDKKSLLKEQTIQDVLNLQRSLLISVVGPISEKSLDNGFLLIPMTPEYISYLLDKKEGVLLCAYAEETLVGYILLTNPSDFKELYKDESAGYLEAFTDLSTLSSWIDDSAVGYIEQIAIKPGYSRKGIGTQLIAKCKELKPQGLIADVFLYPLENRASLLFFDQQGFQKAAVLHQYPTANANFPYFHRSQVFLWNFR